MITQIDTQAYRDISPCVFYNIVTLMLISNSTGITNQRRTRIFFSAFENKDDVWLHSLFLVKHIHQISRQVNIG